ncbi:uncharacterized protein LOC100679213 [Nasonia vitripennis]|uniref:YqaJ viral recombinase domain-containing protein n=1 Tax=Nasonia vitripennis TaxID=7425 RepID=A0A7M7QN58_NASVI|nr:uncharacterized protein LOC100679213 [Nasonia vitripennis]XP_032451974.1 uncharacterized protein LOC100679213 [Nasonia vitripennis]XP_032451975.1 uncharacterized protein LOC100679213 [Nasonia vitripennis]
MKRVALVSVSTLKDCCYEKLISFYKEDILVSCIESESNNAEWRKIRQHRVTRSRVYKLYTYSPNKKPDWKNKSLSYFNPKSFKSKYTNHGIKYEQEAITEYEKYTGTTVTRCGAVISRSNAWMSYTPDGVIVTNGKPSLLLEVKCPYAGKFKGITEVLSSLKYIKITGESVVFTERHEYYAQIQMGMAILNVSSTAFMIYASSDSSFIIFDVPYNENYIFNVLANVKRSYCDKMLHYICSEEIENVQNENNIV